MSEMNVPRSQAAETAERERPVFVVAVGYDLDADDAERLQWAVAKTLRDGRELHEAEIGFLTASIAVWREIDRLSTQPEGYHPTAMDIELREAERRAWEKYRSALDGPGRDDSGGLDWSHGR